MSFKLIILPILFLSSCAQIKIEVYHKGEKLSMYSYRIIGTDGFEKTGVTKKFITKVNGLDATNYKFQITISKKDYDSKSIEFKGDSIKTIKIELEKASFGNGGKVK